MKKVLLFLFLFASPAWATNYYVAKTGGGTTCSMAAPCLTIATGMSKLAPGDTLIISAGTYDEQLTNLVPSGNSSAAPTIIKNATGELVTITKTGSCSGALISQNGGRVNFTFQGDGTVYTPGTTSFSGKFVLDANRLCANVFNFTDDTNATSGITIDGIEGKNSTASGIFIGGHGQLITNSYFHDNGTDDGGATGDDHNIYENMRDSTISKTLLGGAVIGYGIQQCSASCSGALTALSNNVYDRITCKRNTAACILIADGDNDTIRNSISINDGISPNNWGGFRQYTGVTNLKIYNNTVYNCVGTGIIIAFGSAATITNNIVRNCSVKPIGDDIAASTCVNNSWSTSTTSNCTATANPDPSFFNTALDDLHLTASSTTVIGLGADLSASFTTDMDAITRVIPWDLGAFKFVGSSAPPLTLEIRRNNLQSSTSTTAVLDTGASSTPNLYAGPGTAIAILSGTGTEQFRRILSYNGSTKTVTVDTQWVTNPPAGSLYVVIPTAGGLLLRSGTAAAGSAAGASTITLENSASSLNNYYSRAGTGIVITGGAGAGQVRTIIGYVGSTRVATVNIPWSALVDGTSTYSLFPR